MKDINYSKLTLVDVDIRVYMNLIQWAMYLVYLEKTRGEDAISFVNKFMYAATYKKIDVSHDLKDLLSMETISDREVSDITTEITGITYEEEGEGNDKDYSFKGISNGFYTFTPMSIDSDSPSTYTELIIWIMLFKDYVNEDSMIDEGIYKEILGLNAGILLNCMEGIGRLSKYFEGMSVLTRTSVYNFIKRLIYGQSLIASRLPLYGGTGKGTQDKKGNCLKNILSFTAFTSSSKIDKRIYTSTLLDFLLTYMYADEGFGNPRRVLLHKKLSFNVSNHKFAFEVKQDGDDGVDKSYEVYLESIGSIENNEDSLKIYLEDKNFMHQYFMPRFTEDYPWDGLKKILGGDTKHLSNGNASISINKIGKLNHPLSAIKMWSDNTSYMYNVVSDKLTGDPFYFDPTKTIIRVYRVKSTVLPIVKTNITSPKMTGKFTSGGDTKFNITINAKTLFNNAIEMCNKDGYDFDAIYCLMTDSIYIVKYDSSSGKQILSDNGKGTLLKKVFCFNFPLISMLSGISLKELNPHTWSYTNAIMLVGEDSIMFKRKTVDNGSNSLMTYLFTDNYGGRLSIVDNVLVNVSNSKIVQEVVENVWNTKYVDKDIPEPMRLFVSPISGYTNKSIKNIGMFDNPKDDNLSKQDDSKTLFKYKTLMSNFACPDMRSILSGYTSQINSGRDRMMGLFHTPLYIGFRVLEYISYYDDVIGLFKGKRYFLESMFENESPNINNMSKFINLLKFNGITEITKEDEKT